MAAPAFLDTATFNISAEGEKHKLVVISSPTLLRIDEPDDGYSVIYDAKTDHYTGLEHRNYTYWTFSWPEVQAAVESSKRYETRMQDLGNDGLSGTYAHAQAQAAGTNTPSATGSAGSDESGYVWHQTNDKKRVADIDCTLWTGDSLSGESVQAWCATGPIPAIQSAMDRLRVINEPMALVPVRTVVPPTVFTVYDALVKGGVTPVLILWGSQQEKNRFAFVETERRDYKPALFSIPKLYIKTTLITMDGMIDQKK